MTGTITGRDVAQLAGVSQATVSRDLHDDANIAPETRARVLAMLEETGYQPNVAATSMRTRRTATIGVVVGRITNPFYPLVLNALGAELEPRDLRLILWDDTTGPGERAAIEAIDQGRIDELVFHNRDGGVSRPAARDRSSGGHRARQPGRRLKRGVVLGSVAETVLSLASDAAAGITGADVNMTAGVVMY